jgi:YD repeat-containing protein
VTYLDSETEGFVMDDLGNRTGIQTLRGGGTDDYSVDSLTNRYTAIDALPLAYDDAGNLTQDKDGYVYGYDYENRIVEIRNSADAVIAQMDYDTQGRRLRVYDAAAGTETLYYYSDQWQVLAEYTPSGTQQAYYVYGNYIDEVLLMNRAGVDVFYLHDPCSVSMVRTWRPVGARAHRTSAFRRFAPPAMDMAPRWGFAQAGSLRYFGAEDAVGRFRHFGLVGRSGRGGHSGRDGRMGVMGGGFEI